MKNHNSFLHRFFLCSLFSLSTTCIMASTIDSSSIEEEVTTETGRQINANYETYTIDSFEDLQALFLEKEIQWGPETAAFFDNDGTISRSIWDSRVEENTFTDPFFYVCDPDLFRTYKRIADAAADILHERNNSKTSEEYKYFLLEANREMTGGQDWRRNYQFVEENALNQVVTYAREAGSYLKICSGLGLTQNKRYFLNWHQDSLGFEIPLFNYVHEGSDYLCAGRIGKAKRIFEDLTKEDTFGTLERPLKTIILFDNSPKACTGFLEGIKDLKLHEIEGISENVRVISIQYDAFSNMITPDLVADEYERYLDFSTRLIEYNNRFVDSGSYDNSSSSSELYILGTDSSSETEINWILG